LVGWTLPFESRGILSLVRAFLSGDLETGHSTNGDPAAEAKWRLAAKLMSVFHE